MVEEQRYNLGDKLKMKSKHILLFHPLVKVASPWVKLALSQMNQDVQENERVLYKSPYFYKHC